MPMPRDTTKDKENDMAFTITEKRLPWGSTKYGHDYNILAQTREANGGALKFETREEAEAACVALVDGVDVAFRRAIGPDGMSKSLGAPDRYVVVEAKE